MLLIALERWALKQEESSFRKAYGILCDSEKKKHEVTFDEIARSTGWKKSTVRTYATKKWDCFLAKGNIGFYVSGVCVYSEDDFVRLMSQKNAVNREPKKPAFPAEVELLVEKARESAILAVDVYNRPNVKFRTEGFTVLMIIAWRSLFHAYFENKNIPYFHVDDKGQRKQIDGEDKAWELSACVDQYYKQVVNAVRKNLEFMIGLRNRIEHRFAPDLDPHVAGECQALLLNFEDFVAEHFGSYYAIRETLAVALQTSAIRSTEQANSIKRLQSRHYSEIQKYLQDFRNQLPDEIYGDPKFSLRVYLVPKTGNHLTSSDFAMEFVKEDPNNPEMKELEKRIAAIREKHVQVTNSGCFRPSGVVEKVAARTGRPFKIHHHTNAWRLYKVHQREKTPDGCNTKFCHYDVPHRDYVFTKEWVDFLVDKVSDKDEWHKIASFREP